MRLIVTPDRRSAVGADRGGDAFDVLHLAGRHQLPHARDRRGRGTELVPSVHVHDALRLAVQVEHPVERGVAAAENHEPLAVEIGRAANAVVHLPVLEGVAALDAEPARLERAEARRDHDRPREERGAGGGAQQEAAIRLLLQRAHFLAEVEHRVHRLDLLHEPVDEFLGPADWQCGNVVYRLVRIEFGALAARVLERVDDVALDAEQAEFEHLEQARGARADDSGVGFDRGGGSGCDSMATGKVWNLRKDPQS